MLCLSFLPELLHAQKEIGIKDIKNEVVALFLKCWNQENTSDNWTSIHKLGRATRLGTHTKQLQFLLFICEPSNRRVVWLNKCPRVIRIVDFGGEYEYQSSEYNSCSGVDNDTVIAWLLLEFRIATKMIGSSLPGDFGFIGDFEVSELRNL